MSADEIADRLYGLPLAEFTEERNRAAAELRAAGSREEAAEVKALRKPTAAAGAVNRLVREHRDEVEEYLAAAVALRDAQLAGKGDVGAAKQRERELLDCVVRLGGGEVRQSVQAAAVDEEAAEELRLGRLEHELEPRGFGTLAAYARPTPKSSKPKAKPDDRAARAKLREAEKALAAAQAEADDARQRWDEAQSELAEAEAAVEQARSELARLHEQA